MREGREAAWGKRSSCGQGGDLVERGRRFGMLAPVPLANVFSEMLFRISGDTDGYVLPPSILRNIDFVSVYLMRSCQALMRFDDWSFTDLVNGDRSETERSLLGRLRGGSFRPTISIDYGNVRDIVSGILESLEGRLHNDDRQCLRVLHIYVNLVLVYVNKVDQEISEVTASLRSMCVSRGDSE